jgi:hypothetical protein
MAIRFRCRHCPTKLEAPHKLAGRYIQCPACGKNTPVPDTQEETGTYSVIGGDTLVGGADPLERLRIRSQRPGRPTDDDWCVLNYRSLPPRYRDPLDKARSFARRREWRSALTELHELFRSSGDGQILPGNYLVRKPLSFCLTHWAIDELAEMDALGYQPSHSIRMVLKKAEELKKWGGAFTMRECALCGKQGGLSRNSAKMKTSVGWAHLCCAAPTQGDLRLAKALDGIRRRLNLAATLDEKNAEVQDALAALPWWYRVLTTGDPESEQRRGRKSRGDGDRGSGFADLLDAVIKGVVG